MIKERAWQQPSQKAHDRSAEANLLSQTEEAWMAARMQGRKDIVGLLVDDAYRGGSSRGVVQTKKDLVDSVGSPRRPFTQCVHSERSIELVGDLAISTGVATLTSPKRHHSYRYLRVYSKSRGRWRLIASQSAPLPAA